LARACKVDQDHGLEILGKIDKIDPDWCRLAKIDQDRDLKNLSKIEKSVLEFSRPFFLEKFFATFHRGV
jgi:hypothetical protein